MRVLIADDHEPFRTSLRALLSSVDGLEVVGDVGDGDAAVELARSSLADVVLLDLHLPGISGIDATRRIARFNPRPAVVVVSMDDRPEARAVARRAGAFDFVPKGADPDKLLEVLHAAFRTSRARRDAGPMTAGTPELDHDSYSADNDRED